MSSRVETIMVAVVAELTGLTTTGANVDRGAVYNYEPAAVPSLAIYQGDEEPIQFLQSSFIDWKLEIHVESYLQEIGVIETKINTIRQEVHAALMANPTLGLSYVIDIEPDLSQQPELSGAGAKPATVHRMTFNVYYRTSRTDINA